MQPRIEILSEKKLVGKRLTMSFADNQTFRLWQSFMPGRKEINHILNTDLISMQVYPQSFDFTFNNSNAGFDKWAAVEVNDFESIPDEMETFILAGGLYAVFQYTGLSSDTKIFQYIFCTEIISVISKGVWASNKKEKFKKLYDESTWLVRKYQKISCVESSQGRKKIKYSLKVSTSNKKGNN